MFGQTSTPVVVSSRGYLNAEPLTAHTTAPFNSGGSTTLVAFVSSNPLWNGLPVSFGGVSDNVGNTWNLLTGPTTWVGNSFTLYSAIYYVNAPVTSTTHTLTVNLTNPAPLVVDVFAVSGSDITGPPVYSAITDPGAGGISADVMTAPIAVPTNSLLLSWVKNETDATASTLDGYTLDGQSTSFLWAESQTAPAGSSYTGHFQYDHAIGWQTAIVGLRPLVTAPPPPPTITSAPTNPANQTTASFSFDDAEAGTSFLCQLDSSAWSTCSSPTIYTGLSQGSHTFSVVARDAARSQSGATSFSWTIDVTPPPIPIITSTPLNPTKHTKATFKFRDTQAGASYLCQFDGDTFSTCSSPKTYTGLGQGSHTFSVKAQDAAGNPSGAASFSWTIDMTPPPSPVISSMPNKATNQTSASFTFSDSEVGVRFFCKLDSSAFSACSSPSTYTNLGQGSHTFAVEAQDPAANKSSAIRYRWVIE